MNRLTGPLLHVCFEQGPFAQKDLIQACLAWPGLARFWLKSENRTSGFAERDLLKEATDPSYVIAGYDREILVQGQVQSSGIFWILFSDDYNPESYLTNFLLMELREMGQALCSIGLKRSGSPSIETIKNLGDALDWMALAPGCSMDMEFALGEDRGLICSVWYWDFIVKPCLPRGLSLPGLVRVLEVYRKTTPERNPVFEALARAYWLATHEKSSKRKPK